MGVYPVVHHESLSHLKSISNYRNGGSEGYPTFLEIKSAALFGILVIEGRRSSTADLYGTGCAGGSRRTGASTSKAPARARASVAQFYAGRVPGDNARDVLLHMHTTSTVSAAITFIIAAAQFYGRTL